MSVPTFTRFMKTLTRDGAAAEKARSADVDQLREEFGLTEDEAVAVVDRRVDVLLELGMHPVSLMQFSRVFGFSIRRRWDELTEDRRER